MHAHQAHPLVVGAAAQLDHAAVPVSRSTASWMVRSGAATVPGAVSEPPGATTSTRGATPAWAGAAADHGSRANDDSGATRAER